MSSIGMNKLTRALNSCKRTQRWYTSGKKGGSSKRYMDRQVRDPYVRAAALEQYRARSSYKLIGLIDKYKLLPQASNTCVVDCGAAPGGWSQVLARRMAGKGAEPRVIAIDLLAMRPLEGVQILEGDFTEASMKQQIVEIVAGRRVGLVLSDMAPSFTGHRSVDALRTTALCEDVVDFAEEFLSPGGNMVLKYFMGGDEHELRQRLRHMFAQVKIDKPNASRKQSAENYFVCLQKE
ncbi:2' O-ribose methyltransferase [Coemansia sp. RSA 1290]|nr:2' O-ribose methyltransferase [Coemansia sp. RSA 1290]KAJ2649111.1 2' O-ribose methyltransferase [Coemansia sp. RSA 1250]